jgi:hypothetical protein
MGSQDHGSSWGAAVLRRAWLAAEVAVQLSGLEHVPRGGEDGVPDGGDRLGVPASAAQPVVLGGEVGVPSPGGAVGGFGQGCA